MNARLWVAAFATLVATAARTSPMSAQDADGREIRDTTLANGLTVIGVERHVIPYVSLAVTVRGGAATQRPAEQGMAHLFEHLLFRGFRGDPAAFGREMSSLSASYNGATAAESVTFYVTVPAEGAWKALRLLGEMVMKPKFRLEDLAAEKEIVIDEMRRGESRSIVLLHAGVQRRLWGNAWPMKNTIGDSTIVRQISLDQLRAAFQRDYVPNNAAVIITGDFDRAQAFKEVAKAFGDWRRGGDDAGRPVTDIPPLDGDRSIGMVDDIRSAHVLLAWRGPAVRDAAADTYALDMLGAVLEAPSSAFHHRYVDSGLFASVSLNYDMEAYGGDITLVAQTTEESASRAIPALLQAVSEGTLLDGITDFDIAAARRSLIVERLFANEGLAERAGSLAFWWTAGGLDYYRNYEQQLAAQTVATMRAAAERYIINQPRVLGIAASRAAIESVTHAGAAPARAEGSQP